MLLGWHYMDYYNNSYAMNQYLASLGYIVLSVNYRSGIGYGLDFREALNYGATGASEFNDVLGAGLYLRSRPDVDPKRIGLWGGSYGGYLTALGLARASNLFAVGVDFHGVHDWSAELTSDGLTLDAASCPPRLRVVAHWPPSAPGDLPYCSSTATTIATCLSTKPSRWSKPSASKASTSRNSSSPMKSTASSPKNAGSRPITPPPISSESTCSKSKPLVHALCVVAHALLRARVQHAFERPANSPHPATGETALWHYSECMFFRREKPHEPTFTERMDGLRKLGFSTSPAGPGKAQIIRDGIGAIIEDRPGQHPHVNKAGFVTRR